MSCLWDRLHPLVYSHFCFGIVLAVSTGIIVYCYYQIFAYARMCKNMVYPCIFSNFNILTLHGRAGTRAGVLVGGDWGGG